MQTSKPHTYSSAVWRVQIFSWAFHTRFYIASLINVFEAPIFAVPEGECHTWTTSLESRCLRILDTLLRTSDAHYNMQLYHHGQHDW